MITMYVLREENDRELKCLRSSVVTKGGGQRNNIVPGFSLGKFKKGPLK
jgi:hypothetical protein